MMVSRMIGMVVVMVLSVSILSCSSDDNSDGDNGGGSDGLSVSVDGSDFSTETVVAILTNEGRLLTIIGTDINSGESVTISVGSLSDDASLVGEGTFIPATGEDNTSLGYGDGSGTTLLSVDDSGSIDITDFDGGDQVVSGTFSGDLSNFITGDMVTFSDGTFNNISFTVQ